MSMKPTLWRCAAVVLCVYCVALQLMAQGIPPAPNASRVVASSERGRKKDPNRTAIATPALYFPAIATGNSGPDLFKLSTGGSPTPVPLRTDPAASFGSNAGENGGFRELNGNLYFFADTPLATGGLFQMQMDGSYHLIANIGSTFSDAHFTYMNRELYFRAYAGDGDELVRLHRDGTFNSIDVNPGPSSNGSPGADGGFGVFHDSLYFSATTPTTGEDLFRVDAGTNTPVPIEINPGAGSSFAGLDNGYYTFNNHLYFNAFVAADGQAELMQIGGTNDVATPVRDASSNSIPHNFGDASTFQEFAGSLYTEAANPTTFSDTLVKIDSSGVATPFQYMGFDLGSAGQIGGFVEFNNELYFSATTPVTAYDLFKIDAAGTITALNLTNSGSFDAFNGNNPGGFIVYNGSFFFDAYTAGGDTFYRLDSGGTLHIELENGTTLAGANGGFKIFAGNLYFGAYDLNDGNELFQLDSFDVLTHYNINTDATGNSAPGNPGGFVVFPAGEPVVNSAPLDFDGDNISDYAVVRDATSPMPDVRGGIKYGGTRDPLLGSEHHGRYFKLPGERFDPLAPRLDRPQGAPVGGLRWLIHTSGPSGDLNIIFGTLNDFPVPADYDGDGKCDIAVWTGGPAAQFRVLTSSSGFLTTVIYNLGNPASDPSVVGDYDGDGRADPAVFNANTGQWTYLGGPAHTNPVTVTPIGTAGGTVPIPGDFNGDHKYDFVIETRDGINPTSGHFYVWYNDGTLSPPSVTNFVFANYRDVIMPGDYDGDGVTDIGMASVFVNPSAWRIRLSPSGTLIGPVSFGDPNADYTFTGDYNGDQKGEITVWHPAGQFQSLPAPTYSAPTIDFSWGQSGDYPVAYFNSH